VTDRYAVIGNPVAHSKSPFIHAEFARQTAQDLTYERILAPLDGFRAAVDNFRAEGGHGLNVTVPFKLDAFALSADCSERARSAEAVNTLKFDGIVVYGDNTDGVGLVRDIRNNLGVALEGSSVLLMGAGGAAQGVLRPLMDERPARLFIVNRTVDKAMHLVQRLRDAGESKHTHVQAGSYTELHGEQFDVVINATAASLNDAVPELPQGVFAPDALAYDMMYGKGMTPFLQLARLQPGVRLADGLGMLVEQAAESFYLWRGVRPQTPPVIAALRSQ
jgi:shikimate dehydrogenase